MFHLLSLSVVFIYATASNSASCFACCSVSSQCVRRLPNHSEAPGAGQSGTTLTANLPGVNVQIGESKASTRDKNESMQSG